MPQPSSHTHTNPIPLSASTTADAAPSDPNAGDILTYDTDSDYASGLSSYPSTLISSTPYSGFRSANGRRYVSRRQVEYSLPHDEEEAVRLDILHNMWGLALDGSLFRAPIGEAPTMILDVGTGTGLWAVEVAEKFPKAQVIGTDIAPSRLPWAPPNLDLQAEDIEADWLFDSNTFDLVHIRSMAGFVADWPRLLAQSLAVLKPGGWIEFHDFSSPFECDDGSYGEDSALKLWVREWEAGAVMSGKDWNTVGPRMKDMLGAVGFVDVTEERHRVQTTGRPTEEEDSKWREIGSCILRQGFDGAEGISLDMFIRVLGWEKKDVEELVARVRREMMNPDTNTYTRVHIIYARKPEW